MEEVGKEGPIQSIFLCEFHPVRGPIIVCQYPEKFISKEIFEAISVYLIPKPQIKKCTISVNVFDLKITGYPNIINNSKYERNAFMFNLCIVCKSDSRTVQYEPVVKKLSEYFENLEQENDFLSNEDDKKQLPGLLKKIVEDMNASGKCTVRAMVTDRQHASKRVIFRPDRRPSEFAEKQFLTSREVMVSDNTIKTLQEDLDHQPNIMDAMKETDPPYISVAHLKAVRLRPDPVHVQDQSVPVLACKKEEATLAVQHWDLTTQQILPDIDGVAHVGKIAVKADVDINLVKSCVQNLVYYGVVVLLPIFVYSNMYTTLPGLHKLYTNKELKEECLRTVSRSANRLPSMSMVFQIYSSLVYGVTVRDLCIRYNTQALNIDECKLIQFGILHNFIRRVHVFPVALVPQEDPPTPQETRQSLTLHKMCNGLHSVDEICCKFGMTPKEVCDRLEKDSNIVLIRK